MLIAFITLLSAPSVDAAGTTQPLRPFAAALVQHDGVLSLVDASRTLASRTAAPPTILAG